MNPQPLFNFLLRRGRSVSVGPATKDQDTASAEKGLRRSQEVPVHPIAVSKSGAYSFIAPGPVHFRIRTPSSLSVTHR